MPKIKKPHAFINRIHVRLGFALALVCGLPVTAQAAYANLTPPPGWVQGGGAVVAGPGGAYAAQSMANQWIANASKSSAMLNVGGKQQAVNVAMKMAPNAGKVAAAFLYTNPYLRTAVGIAAWFGAAKIAWDEVNKRWIMNGEQDGFIPSDGYKYVAVFVPYVPEYSQWDSMSSLCSATLAGFNANNFNPDYSFSIKKCQFGAGNIVIGSIYKGQVASDYFIPPIEFLAHALLDGL